MFLFVFLLGKSESFASTLPVVWCLVVSGGFLVEVFLGEPVRVVVWRMLSTSVAWLPRCAEKEISNPLGLEMLDMRESLEKESKSDK